MTKSGACPSNESAYRAEAAHRRLSCARPSGTPRLSMSNRTVVSRRTVNVPPNPAEGRQRRRGGGGCDRAAHRHRCDPARSNPVLPKALTRFRIPWRWAGGPVTLMSRAVDDTCAVQPRRADWVATYGVGQGYHSNAIQSWHVDRRGHVSHVYV